MSERPDWPTWALGIATAVARRSEDMHVPVGAVALRSDWSVCGVGYNGAPSGVELIWSDRAARRPYVIHAEVNALRHASVMDMQGGAIVTTHIPCGNCMTVLASYKIDRVYYGELLDGETYDLGLIESIAAKCRITLFHL